MQIQRLQNLVTVLIWGLGHGAGSKSVDSWASLRMLREDWDNKDIFSEENNKKFEN